MNLNVLHNVYQNSLFENEKHTAFWENYLRDLNALDFKTYSDKLTVPVLVPIGSRILFRGELKHTNEVTVSLGADYFVKCSIAQAEILRDHRIKDAKSKLDLLKKEKEYLENQISFSKHSVNENAGKDIIEVCTEEEDKAWRKLHRERVRQHKQKKDKTEEKQSEMTDEDLWNRLEELELEEELKNELSNIETRSQIEDSEVEMSSTDENAKDNGDNNNNDSNHEDEHEDNKDENEGEHRDENEDDLPMPTEELSRKFRLINDLYKQSSNLRNESKIDLLHQIIERRKLVVETLSKLKRRVKPICKNENELVSRLDEMEQIDELEDEMERLEELINETESIDVVEESEEDEESEESDSKLKKSVSFADEDSSETIEITFKHSLVEPTKDPYDPEKGIIKPSDVYEAFSSKQPETCSILKKTKYPILIETQIQPNQNMLEKEKILPDSNTTKTIVVKDVVEKLDQNDNNLNNDVRPMSLFKKRRQQQKS